MHRACMDLRRPLNTGCDTPQQSCHKHVWFLNGHPSAKSLENNCNYNLVFTCTLLLFQYRPSLSKASRDLLDSTTLFSLFSFRIYSFDYKVELALGLPESIVYRLQSTALPADTLKCPTRRAPYCLDYARSGPGRRHRQWTALRGYQSTISMRPMQRDEDALRAASPPGHCATATMPSMLAGRGQMHHNSRGTAASE